MLDGGEARDRSPLVKTLMTSGRETRSGYTANIFQESIRLLVLEDVSVTAIASYPLDSSTTCREQVPVLPFSFATLILLAGKVTGTCMSSLHLPVTRRLQQIRRQGFNLQDRWRREEDGERIWLLPGSCLGRSRYKRSFAFSSSSQTRTGDAAVRCFFAAKTQDSIFVVTVWRKEATIDRL